MTIWTKIATLELINEYKRKTLLWNKNHKNFYYREKRAEAIAELAAIFEVRPKQVQAKMWELMRIYQAELSKVIQSKAKSSENTYEPQWFAYKALDSFLHRKYVDLMPVKNNAPAASSSTTDNENDATADNDNDAIPDNDNDATVDNDNDATRGNEEVQVVDSDEVEVYKIEDSSDDEINRKEEDTSPTSTDIKNQETNTVGNPLPEHQEVDNCEPSIKRPKLVEATSRSRRRTYADVRKRDDCDLFGKYVSGTMREFDRKTRCVVQYLVSNILCQADLGAFQNGSFDWQSLVGFRGFNTKRKCNEDEN